MHKAMKLFSALALTISLSAQTPVPDAKSVDSIAGEVVKSIKFVGAVTPVYEFGGTEQSGRCYVSTVAGRVYVSRDVFLENVRLTTCLTDAIKEEVFKYFGRHYYNLTVMENK